MQSFDCIKMVVAMNRYGHPHAELLERLEEVGTTLYRTDQGGAIILSVDGADMKLREYVK